MNIAYIIVLSIQIYIILRAYQETYIVLINKGIEANLISQKIVLVLSLLIIEGQFLNINTINSKINIIGIYQNVRVNIFRVIFFFDFIVSRNLGLTLLGQLQARKVRLYSSNYDNSSQKGIILDTIGKSIVFIDIARPSSYYIIEELISSSRLTTRVFRSGKVIGSRQ